MKTYTHFSWLFIALFFSCKLPYEATSNTDSLYKVENSVSDTVSDIEKLLRPYRNSLDKTMNEVIGYAMGDFIKEKPSGSLGNLVVDAMFEKSKTQNPNTKGAICNYGGIRIPEIKKGDISVGKIFELLPFENELVILEIKGDNYKKWLNTIAEAGGWPLVYIHRYKTFKFVNNRFINYFDTLQVEHPDGSLEFRERNFDIENDSTYYIATNDYIANGGDNCNFLKSCKRTNTGILIRDLMIDYIRSKKNIVPDAGQRIKLLDK